MIRTSYDAGRNTVILEFLGRIDAAQAEKMYEEVEKVVPRHGRGFKLLTDLIDVESTDPKMKEPIRKLMRFLNAEGVTEIVRIIPDPSKDIGLNIMSAFHYSKEVQFITVQTREEAWERL